MNDFKEATESELITTTDVPISVRRHGLSETAYKLRWLLPLILFMLIPKYVAVPLVLAIVIYFLLQSEMQWLLKKDSSLRRFIPASKLSDSEKYSLRKIRPFILWGMFLVAPLAVPVMAWDWVKRVILKKNYLDEVPELPEGAIRFRQNISRHEEDEESNFYLSPAFAMTTAAICRSGLPAARAYVMDPVTGMDALFGYASRSSHFNFIFFFCGLYAAGLAWSLMPLFMRAWLTFPVQHGSAEYDVILDKNKIQKLNVKGWAADVLLLGFGKYFPKETEWKEIAYVEIEQEGFGRLCPLSDSLFSKDSLIYKTLDKLAGLIDASVDKLGRAEYLVLKTQYEKDYTGGLKVRLWELTAEEKVKLYYAIRNWAPSIHITERVQQELVGSTVLNDPRYTNIWFDLLLANPTRNNSGSLIADQKINDKYTIVEKLATGGQAVAYLARTESGENVVLKEFVLATGDGIEALVASAADFENESSLLGQISHPQIVQMKEVFLADNRAYLVLEHVTGSTLRDYVKEHGRVSAEQAKKFATQMCDVLTYLHSQTPPIIHRDFTPDNLILQEHGSIKLIDFSIAETPSKRTKSETAGKHSYTSPEQFRGEASTQSDLYALGASLYYVLTGKDPVPISMSNPCAIDSTISPKLGAIVAKATALQLEDRYETADWLKLDLDLDSKSITV